MLKSLVDSSVFLRVVEVIDHRSENRISEFGMLAQAFEFVKINGLDGDYFEFGLWRGKTFCCARNMARRYRVEGITFRGFDSFEGLPTTTETRYSIWSKGQFACTRDELERILQRKGFTKRQYQLVDGFYEKSLTPQLTSSLLSIGVKAAIVYIDCDLYESTRLVLDFINPFLQDGTVICFDDFFAFRGRPDMGEQRALREFLVANPQVILNPYLVYGSLGMSFICSLRLNDHGPSSGC